MSLTAEYQSLDVEKLGTQTTIPYNNLARLMYYLKCVFAVIEVDYSGKLTDYKNYDRLSKNEGDLVLSLAILFTPDILIKNYIFFIDSKCCEFFPENEFYKLTNNRIGIHVNSEVMIGGISRKVLKTMGCNKPWLERYYYDPMNEFSSILMKEYSSVDKGCCCDCLCDKLDCFESCFDDCCNCNGCCDNCCNSYCKKFCCIFLLLYFVGGTIIGVIVGSIH